MKSIITIIIIFILFPEIKSQPYLYLKLENNQSEIYRYDISSNLAEYFFTKFGEDVAAYWDPTQSYLRISSRNLPDWLINCSDTAFNFELDELFGVSFYAMLYSYERNKIYLFSEEKKIFVLDLLSHEITSELTTNAYLDFGNILMEPDRTAFFSRNNEKIYFYGTDSTYSSPQVWEYSLSTNQIINKWDLSSLGGYPGTDASGFSFGKKGKAIIESGPNYNNPVKEYYYKLYDFDSDSSSPFIYHNGYAEAYFSGDGEFILLMDTHLDDTLNYYHTGLGSIYNSESGQLIKTFSVPPGGTIYTFDTFPNDIYYIRNLETQPEIINLTKINLSSLTPAMSLPYALGLTIEIRGGLFTNTSQAYFNNQTRTTNYLNDTAITIQLNAGDISSLGNYPIWVNNYGSNSDTLIYSVVQELPQLITPFVECVKNNGGGSYTAKFGYLNNNINSVFVPVGTNNKFSPAPENRGQSTIFLPGRNYEVFSVDFDGRNLVWNIFTKKATASKNSTPCP
jgi:hypothetical protein